MSSRQPSSILYIYPEWPYCFLFLCHTCNKILPQQARNTSVRLWGPFLGQDVTLLNKAKTSSFWHTSLCHIPSTCHWTSAISQPCPPWLLYGPFLLDDTLNFLPHLPQQLRLQLSAGFALGISAPFTFLLLAIGPFTHQPWVMLSCYQRAVFPSMRLHQPLPHCCCSQTQPT